jgi:hypothetical protein
MWAKIGGVLLAVVGGAGGVAGLVPVFWPDAPDTAVMILAAIGGLVAAPAGFAAGKFVHQRLS